MVKSRFTLVDSCFYPFGSRSASLGGERNGESPRGFEWTNELVDGPIFFTDIRLSEVAQYESHPFLKIAWIIEPTWKPAHYEAALRLIDKFDYVISYRQSYFPADKFLYAPIGGSWIRACDWGIKPKTRDISIIGTQKTKAPGHQLRHSVIERLSRRLGVYGRGYAPIESKLTALAPYRFSVVIESERTELYFTEKLIDCLSQGTVPIYWGSVLEQFDPRGILCVYDSSADGFSDALDKCTPELYEKMKPYILLNYHVAHNYQCTEDWIYTRYPFLFS